MSKTASPPVAGVDWLEVYAAVRPVLDRLRETLAPLLPPAASRSPGLSECTKHGEES